MTSAALQTHARSAYGLLIKTGTLLQSPFLLGVRLYWGWQFFQAGRGKLKNLGQVTEFFTGLGIPFPAFNAGLAASTECFGGLLLIAGLASRLTAVPLIITMVVAYITADREAVQTIFSEPDNFVTATPFLFLLASFIIFIFGPGAFSLDRLLSWKFEQPTTRSVETKPDATSTNFAR